MTMRQLGSFVIKLMGPYSAIGAFAGLAALAEPYLIDTLQSETSLGAGFQLTALWSSTQLAVAIIALVYAESISGWIFGGEVMQFSSLPRRDWLFIGINLVGLTWVLIKFPYIIYATGKAVILWEANRNEIFGKELFRQEMMAYLDSVLFATVAVVAGVIVMFNAHKIANRLDRPPESNEADTTGTEGPKGADAD